MACGDGVEGGDDVEADLAVAIAKELQEEWQGLVDAVLPAQNRREAHDDARERRPHVLAVIDSVDDFSSRFFFPSSACSSTMPADEGGE